MISCFVIGEKPTVQTLKSHIENFLLTRLIGYSTDPVKDLGLVVNYKPQIVFVDISLIDKYRPILIRIAQECTIIYIASCTDYAFEAFEILALDYLVKPISFERFEKSINKFIHFSLLSPPPQASILKRAEPITDSFFIKADVKGQKLISIKCNEVLYIEADQNYVLLHLVDQKQFICHNTMKEMEESLPLSYFIRVHKSFIINYDKVTSIEGNIIILNHNEKQKILIGNTYRKAFFDRKNLKLIKKHKGNFLPLDIYSHTASIVLFLTLTSFNWFDFAVLDLLAI